MKEATKFKETEIGPIPEEWDVTMLSQASKIFDSLHQTPKYSEVGLPMVRVTDIKSGLLNLDNTLFVSAEVYKKFTEKYTPSIGDIVISRVGSYGIFSFVSSNANFCLGQNTAIINPKINNRYLYYFLSSNIVKKQINEMVVGSTQKTLSLEGIKKIIISYPNDNEQKQIAEILSSLDDKIELLREENKTLEAIAQTIFKEWFVNFNFPGATGKMIDSELGQIPEGWRVGKIKDEIKTILGGTPSRFNASYWKNGSISWINSGAINNFPITRSTEYITEDGLNNSATKLMPPKTVVLPLVITPGSEIKISFIGIESAGNQSVLGLLETNRFSCGYIYLWLQNMKNKLYSGATGGAQQHINKQEVDELELLIPKGNTLAEFSNISDLIFEKIIQNSFQTQNLSALRDSLLPRLMSGKIRVNI